jgi:hypothetical protein
MLDTHHVAIPDDDQRRRLDAADRLVGMSLNASMRFASRSCIACTPAWLGLIFRYASSYGFGMSA